ncbi:hypothetical protein TruAng_005130 [Truncatella angustata]|nr:hypothetical protein TruAng_005130 [Truncatella angustata]
MAISSSSYHYLRNRRPSFDGLIEKDTVLRRHPKTYHTLLLNDLYKLNFFEKSGRIVLETDVELGLMKLVQYLPGDFPLLSGTYRNTHREGLVADIGCILPGYLKLYSALLSDDLRHRNTRREKESWNVEDRFGLIVPVEHKDEDDKS